MQLMCLQGSLKEARQGVNLIFELNQQLVCHLQSLSYFTIIGSKSTRLYNIQRSSLLLYVLMQRLHAGGARCGAGQVPEAGSSAA